MPYKYSILGPTGGRRDLPDSLPIGDGSIPIPNIFGVFAPGTSQPGNRVNLVPAYKAHSSRQKMLRETNGASPAGLWTGAVPADMAYLIAHGHKIEFTYADNDFGLSSVAFPNTVGAEITPTDLSQTGPWLDTLEEIVTTIGPENIDCAYMGNEPAGMNFFLGDDPDPDAYVLADAAASYGLMLDAFKIKCASLGIDCADGGLSSRSIEAAVLQPFIDANDAAGYALVAQAFGWDAADATHINSFAGKTRVGQRSPSALAFLAVIAAAALPSFDFHLYRPAAAWPVVAAYMRANWLSSGQRLRCNEWGMYIDNAAMLTAIMAAQLAVGLASSTEFDFDQCNLPAYGTGVYSIHAMHEPAPVACVPSTGSYGALRTMGLAFAEFIDGLAVASSQPFSVLDGFQAVASVNGGVTDLTGRVGATEIAGYPQVYLEGATLVVSDPDDADFVVARGRLDEPRPGSDGAVQLHAEGPCQKLGQSGEKRRLWQSRSLDEWTTEDSPPYSYDTDDQIEATIKGREMILGWKRKEVFLRATGKANLQTAANVDDDTITTDLPTLGLKAGEQISIGNETRTVKSTYTQDSTTVPLANPLDSHHDAGAHVRWRASGNPAKWASGFAAWYPTVTLQRVFIEFEKVQGRNEPGSFLRVYVGNGPDGATTQVAQANLGAGGPTSIEINGVSGNKNHIRIRLERTDQDEKATAFKLKLKPPVINGLAGPAAGGYTTSQVAHDVANFRNAYDVTNIVDSSVNAMPLDPGLDSDATVMDRMALTDNRWWSIEPGGVEGLGDEWHYEEWDSTTWVVSEPRDSYESEPLPRFNVAVVPFRYAEGGVSGLLSARADPDPFPAEERTLAVPLNEPLPIFDVAQAFAQNAANMLAESRDRGRVKIFTVEDPEAPGVPIPAHRVRVGHTLLLTQRGLIPVRVMRATYNADHTVDVEWGPPDGSQTGVPALDAILAQRDLAIARGRPNSWATLNYFDLAEPEPMQNLTFGFREVETQAGHRRWNLISDWDPVYDDVEGNGTAIDEYVIQAQPVDKTTGTPIKRDDGGGIHHIHVTKKRDRDPVSDDVPTHAVLEDVPNPHKWKWRVRGLAKDVLQQKSDLTPWSPSALPASFKPNPPTSVTVDVDQHKVVGAWTANDPTELNILGEPQVDRTIRWFRWWLYRDGVLEDKGHTAAEQVTIKVKKPRAHVFRFDVASEDVYGNLSARVSANNVRGAPPTPLQPAGPVTFNDGSHEGVTARAPICYVGDWTDDDISRIHVRWLYGKTPPAATDEVAHRDHISVKPDDDLCAITSKWHGRKVGKYVRYAYAVEDTKGQRSVFSPFSASYLVTDGQIPNLVTDAHAEPDGNGVTIKYKSPTTASDGVTPIGRDDTDHFEVELLNSLNVVVDTDMNVRSEKRRFRTKGFADGPFKGRIRAVGIGGSSAGTASTDGSSERELIDPDDIDVVDLNEIAVNLGAVYSGYISSASGPTDDGARIVIDASTKDRINVYGNPAFGLVGSIHADQGDLYIAAVGTSRVAIDRPQVRAGHITYEDTDASSTTPGLSAGGAEALPATPFKYLKFDPPSGEACWIAIYKP